MTRRFRTIVAVFAAFGSSCIPSESPDILWFVATPTELGSQGGAVVLDWFVAHADRVTISHVDDDLPPTGTLEVTVTQTTTFQLVVAEDGSTRSVIVSVRPGLPESREGTGRIRDLRGAPIAGWHVSSDLGETVTDSQGRYSLPIPKGDYRIHTYPPSSDPNVEAYWYLGLQAPDQDLPLITARNSSAPRNSATVFGDIELAADGGTDLTVHAWAISRGGSSWWSQSANPSLSYSENVAWFGDPQTSVDLVAYSFRRVADDDVQLTSFGLASEVPITAGVSNAMPALSLRPPELWTPEIRFASGWGDPVAFGFALTREGFDSVLGPSHVGSRSEAHEVQIPRIESLSSYLTGRSSASGGWDGCPGCSGGHSRTMQISSNDPIELGAPPVLQLQPAGGAELTRSGSFSWTSVPGAICVAEIFDAQRIFVVLTRRDEIPASILPWDFGQGIGEGMSEWVLNCEWPSAEAPEPLYPAMLRNRELLRPWYHSSARTAFTFSSQ